MSVKDKSKAFVEGCVEGFVETHIKTPAVVFLILIFLLLLFGEPIAHWLAQ